MIEDTAGERLTFLLPLWQAINFVAAVIIIGIAFSLSEKFWSKDADKERNPCEQIEYL